MTTVGEEEFETCCVYRTSSSLTTLALPRKETDTKSEMIGRSRTSSTCLGTQSLETSMSRVTGSRASKSLQTIFVIWVSSLKIPDFLRGKKGKPSNCFVFIRVRVTNPTNPTLTLDTIHNPSLSTMCSLLFAVCCNGGLMGKLQADQ